jgi:hypothetical protein
LAEQLTRYVPGIVRGIQKVPFQILQFIDL